VNKGEYIMSGAIAENGQQWEHCTLCGKLHKIQNLGYLPATAKYPNGLDIGLCCINKLSQDEIYRVIPSKSWTAKYS
jgi:hypothetical protein